MAFPNIIPLPVEAITQIEPKFTRKSEDGHILCYADPEYKLIFQYDLNEVIFFEIWKKTVQVTGSAGGDAVDYVMQLEVDYEVGKMQANFADIRFALDDGTVLAYNLLSVQSNKAIFDVKIPFIPQNGQVNVNIYSGNPDATVTTSNPFGVYSLYENWESEAIDTKWYIIRGNPTVINDTDGNKVLRLIGGTGDTISTNTLKKDSLKIYYRLKIHQNGIYGPRFSAKVKRLNNTGSSSWEGFLIEHGTTGYRTNWIGSDNSLNLANYDEAWAIDQWYDLYLFANNSKITAKSATQVLSANLANDVVGYISFDVWDANNTIYIDEIRVCPYLDPEPSMRISSEWTKVFSNEYPEE